MLFYSEAISDNGVILNANDSRHAVKSLRLKEGDTIEVTDGHGSRFRCSISKADARQCIAEIVENEEISRRKKYLHVAIAPTKSIDRLESFVEKSTEIGIEEITPIICDNSERRIVKRDRLSRIAVSAMKQSGGVWLPSIDEPMGFSSFLTEYSDLHGNVHGDVPVETKRIIAHCEDSERKSITDVLKGVQRALILIGPEGDFSAAEIELAIASGFEPVSLGDNRLRTETAGIVATTIFDLYA